MSTSSNERAVAPGNPSTTVAGLELAGITKGYGESKRYVLALDGIDLRVDKGQFVTLIGPSGCGKSTLLRIIAGLIEPDEGTTTIFGESVERAKANKHIGLVPQSLGLLAWRTVLDNVKLPLELGRADAPGSAARRPPEEILAALGLGDVMSKRPGELSGGMRQRVAIAHAFALEPAVLLMDEPFSSLDELTAETLRHELLSLWQAQRSTVLFVTHSVSEAVVLSDAVVVMSKAPGRIEAVVPIDLPRPRNDLVELTAAFHEAEAQVRVALRRGAGDVSR